MQPIKTLAEYLAAKARLDELEENFIASRRAIEDDADLTEEQKDIALTDLDTEIGDLDEVIEVYEQIRDQTAIGIAARNN